MGDRAAMGVAEMADRVQYHEWGVNLDQAFHAVLTDTQTVSIDGPERLQPERISLLSCCPNPFNSETLIRYRLNRPEQVQLAVYNLSGVRVATLQEGVQEPGMHQLRWNASAWPSGVYLIVLQGTRVKKVIKAMLLN